MPSLFSHYLHLGPGGRAVEQPAFTGMDWYAGYGARHGEDGGEGRLVSLSRFSAPWTSWEMHPAGDEVVVCVGGRLTLHQEQADGSIATLTLGAGDFAINPAGVWHTADVEDEATALFITTGLGTENRPR